MIKQVDFIKNNPYLSLSLLPIIVSFLVSIIFFSGTTILPNKLPLFYSLPWGEQQLVDKYQLLIIPAAICLISLLNFILLTHLHQSQSFFKKILIYTTILTTLLLFMTLTKIILIFV